MSTLFLTKRQNCIEGTCSLAIIIIVVRVVLVVVVAAAAAVVAVVLIYIHLTVEI